MHEWTKINEKELHDIPLQPGPHQPDDDSPLHAIRASGAEEWIFGRTDAARRVLCQINVYIFAFTTSISVHTISAISVDRFLFIVKPQLHKRFMTWKTSLSILAVIWVSYLIDAKYNHSSL